ncbi:hypothetical protein [Ilumatobacter sp.]|uniref:hypothetical protein n=1 Tax=Ilumatobacter sp. TaxID=1967498 RepID=UPI003B5280DC
MTDPDPDRPGTSAADALGDDSATADTAPVAAGGTGPSATTDDEIDDLDPSRDRRRLDWGLLVPSLVIACGLVAIAWAVTSAITGMDGIDRPDAIEDIAPVERAQQVQQQEQVIVDLEFGYEAALVVNGVELETTRIGEFDGDVAPGEQIAVPPTAVFDPGNSRIEFRPSDDAVIQSFPQGRNSVQVIFWRVADGRDDGARSYRWSFDVV